jgi:tight adherence protein C
MRVGAAALWALSAAIVVLAAGRAPGRATGRALRRRGGGTRIGLLRGWLSRVRRLAPRLVAVLARRDIRLALQRAGLDAVLTERDVAAARVVCVGAVAVFVPRLAQALPLRTLPVALGLMFWAAAELPLFVLARRARGRAAAVRATLPDALDLLRACLAAGLPLRRSLALVAEHCADPVASEFAAVAAETAYGVPQAAALEGFAARNPQREARALVSAIGQAERNGSPLAPVIAAQAEEARWAHNREIVERGARAGPKIQLVVAATIVPGALLGLAAVVVAAIARGEIRMI